MLYTGDKKTVAKAPECLGLRKKNIFELFYKYQATYLSYFALPFQTSKKTIFLQTEDHQNLTKDEEKILIGCKKGKQQAQYQFYDLFKKLVFSVAMRYARDVPEAEDIMQDAFVNLYRDLYQYEPTGALGGWVRRVTVNTALMHLRKKRMLFSDVEIHTLAEQQQGQDDILSNIGAREIMKMVQQLPDGYRVVFNLYVVEGFTHKEIGEQLKISENTSKSQLSRAKKMLRGVLEKSLME